MDTLVGASGAGANVLGGIGKAVVEQPTNSRRTCDWWTGTSRVLRVIASYSEYGREDFTFSLAPEKTPEAGGPCTPRHSDNQPCGFLYQLATRESGEE